MTAPTLKQTVLGIAWCFLILGPARGYGSDQHSNDRPEAVGATSRVAIISAFEPELAKLRKEADIKEVRVINGRSHYLGRLAGHDVVLLLSGFSMVNAAMTTQGLLDHFTIREIVFSGIAGGVNPNLHVGDVTVPACWGQYQDQAFGREIPGGWDAGRFGGDFPNYGMMFPHRISVTRRDAEPDKLEKRFWFPADPASLEIARRIAGSVKLDQQTAEGDSLLTTPQVVVGGNGVSGPSFVDNAPYRQWVWTTFKADALDMETAAVGTVAYVNRVPFIAFRSLSDLAGGGPGKNESALFFKLAADNSARVVLAYLQALDETKIGVVASTKNTDPGQ
jgi:adenosylhomocysteine nucleosidase